jgi:hypothetical protein
MSFFSRQLMAGQLLPFCNALIGIPRMGWDRE